MVQVKGLNLGKGHPKICAPMIGDTREELCEKNFSQRSLVLI